MENTSWHQRDLDAVKKSETWSCIIESCHLPHYVSCNRTEIISTNSRRAERYNSSIQHLQLIIMSRSIMSENLFLPDTMLSTYVLPCVHRISKLKIRSSKCVTVRHGHHQHCTREREVVRMRFVQNVDSLNQRQYFPIRCRKCEKKSNILIDYTFGKHIQT